jgi:hypothetical protein
MIGLFKLDVGTVFNAAGISEFLFYFINAAVALASLFGRAQILTG